MLGTNTKDEEREPVEPTQTPAKERRRKKERRERDPDDPREKDKDKDKDKDRDRERERDREKDPDRPRRRKKKSASKEREREREKEKDKDKEGSEPSSRKSQPSRKMTGSAPEIEGKLSFSMSNGSRSSLPYPGFSKAHCRESVQGSREDVSKPPRPNPFTPDPTDLSQEGRSKSGEAPAGDATRPLSPPLTADDADIRRVRSASSVRRRSVSAQESPWRPKKKDKGDDTGRHSASPRESASRSSLRKTAKRDADSGTSEGTRKGSPITVTASPRPPGRTASTGSHRAPTVSSQTDSDATSVAPERKAAKKSMPIPRPAHLDTSSSPLSVVDSSPRTPTQDQALPPVTPQARKTPGIDVFPSRYASPAVGPSPTTMAQPPPPPPPPPPPTMPVSIPRVDYLLQNGGLNHLIPKHLSGSVNQQHVQSYQQYMSPALGSLQTPDMIALQSVFAPLHRLLEDYNTVLSKSGSVAVATGYKSVARRLLNRLEAVFARNISSEHCHCIMCQAHPDYDNQCDDSGVSWGEVLEFVSGRRELPSWPPFSITTDGGGLGISGLDSMKPMQKMDVDVPDEYREHYVRQSKKTKAAVQDWLAAQPEEPSSPPEEVDDETLTFAIMTHLEPEQRPVFGAILKGRSRLPASNAPTPVNEPADSELITRTALALERLYRLGNPPRPAECTIYLLRNPELHGVLATLAGITSGEWDILVSGRFDGFLWSGADTYPPPSYQPSISRGPSRNGNSAQNSPYSPTGQPPSRGPTPLGAPSRGQTPAPGSTGGPVPLDEETEIAVLAEVEREIFTGMEALEDAFEALHVKAEGVRRALRERSTGLQMAAQARRGSGANDIEVRMGTPASAMGWESETDDGLDERSELAPDDSASNVSFNRRRRKARGQERRTPAPVEELDEE